MPTSSRSRPNGWPATLALVAAVLLVPPVEVATAVELEQDKAAFLQATGATSATGPLPDLGGSIASSGPISVGNITFALAPGGNSITIGATGTGVEPDWYPPTPGHDIAMGFENLEIRTNGPVHALGFDIVEPNTTMPGWGGTPVDSPFTLTLFAGSQQVGQTVFNAPDDVLAFQGVWSDVPFDRVWVIDSTGNVDDEYFGEVYTGTIPGPPSSTLTVVGSGSPVPGGPGVITGFPDAPVATAAMTLFTATGSQGSSGVYVGDRTLPGQLPVRIADRSTPVPESSGTFSTFGQVAAVGEVLKPEGPPIRVAFTGEGEGQQGIYLSEVTAGRSPGEPQQVAAASTAIPAGQGTFTGFSGLALGVDDVFKPEGPPIRVAFTGEGVGQQGIYSSAVDARLKPEGPPIRIVDLSTPIPDGHGTFTAFDGLVGTMAAVAFVGDGSGQQGVYVADVAKPEGPPIRLADLATPIPGGHDTFTGFDGLALDGDGAARPDGPPIRVAYIGTGAGQQGVYRSDVDHQLRLEGPPIRVADLATPIPEGVGTFTRFLAVSASHDHVAFLAEGADGQLGIYRASSLSKVVAVGDVVDGRTVSDLRLGPSGLVNGGVVFTAEFTDGTSAVATTTVGTYPFIGFQRPVVNPPAINQANAGRAIPLKFSLAGDRGLQILPAGSPSSQQVGCDDGRPTGPVSPAVSPGASGLTYDASTDTYAIVWKTDKRWAGTCRLLTLGLRDGSTHQASFSFR